MPMAPPPPHFDDESERPRRRRTRRPRARDVAAQSPDEASLAGLTESNGGGLALTVSTRSPAVTDPTDLSIAPALLGDGTEAGLAAIAASSKAEPPPRTSRRNGRSHEEAVAILDAAAIDELREIRAEVQGLQAVLSGIQKGTLTLPDYASYMTKSVERITTLVEATESVRNYSDNIRCLHTSWEQLLSCPLIASPGTAFSTSDQLKYLDTVASLLDRMVMDIGYLTIPSRVNSWLKDARPGYYIPFHTVFADELPSYEARASLLNYLAWAPLAVDGGLVDSANGLIYRYSKSATDRVLGLLFLIATIAGALGALVASAYLPINDWPLEGKDLTTLLVGFGAIVLGTVFHLCIATQKRSKAEGKPPIIAVSELLLILNARLGQIVWKIVMALIALYSLVFSVGIDQLTALNAFLAGYALDSVVEAFGSTIEQKAGARAAAPQ